jgi:hypothetical protein
VFCKEKCDIFRRSAQFEAAKEPFSFVYVGAGIARPLKIGNFRIFPREITEFSPCGDSFYWGKICGRPMAAPTADFFHKLCRNAEKTRC